MNLQTHTQIHLSTLAQIIMSCTCIDTSQTHEMWRSIGTLMLSPYLPRLQLQKRCCCSCRIVRICRIGIGATPRERRGSWMSTSPLQYQSTRGQGKFSLQKYRKITMSNQIRSVREAPSEERGRGSEHDNEVGLNQSNNSMALTGVTSTKGMTTGRKRRRQRHLIE